MTAADPFVKAIDVALTPDAMAQVAGFRCVLREPAVVGSGGGPRGAGPGCPARRRRIQRRRGFSPRRRTSTGSGKTHGGSAMRWIDEEAFVCVQQVTAVAHTAIHVSVL